MKKIKSWQKGSRRPLLADSFRQTGHSQAESTPLSAQDGPSCDGLQSDWGVRIQNPATSRRDRAEIIEILVSCHLPVPPADLRGNLRQYLLAVQETLRKDLVQLGPQLRILDMVGTLVESYHRQIFHLLNHLLQKTSDLQSLFILMTWVLQTYLSQDMFGQLTLLDVDVRENLDLLLLTEWVTTAKNKLLQSVKEEFRASMGRILELHKTHIYDDDEEACVGFYVDMIQLIEAPPADAGRVSPSLVAEVQEICFQELLNILQRYAAEQTEILEKKTKMDKREMIYFLKTLKTCKEIKQHVRNKTTDNKVTKTLLQDVVAVLEHMEAFTLTCVEKVMSKVAKSLLKSYFTGQTKQFFHLIYKVKTCFPEAKWFEDVMEKLVVRIYEIIAHTYLTHLVKVRRNKLTKCWSPNIVQTVTKDAKLLHNTISELVPAVTLLNPILLKVPELLDCDSLDMVLLTIATTLQEFLLLRKDPDLQVALLRWKGLSAWQARNVLEAIPGQHQSRSVFWSCCLA